MDDMSSPDPLNASLEGSAFMSARRVTRSQSQASSRLSSVNPSPRKQTFALDVGDERSPQKILVTVEADDRDSHNSNVKRKLFQSPTPKRVVRRREKTTTTVVPLKGLTDDEGGEPSTSVAPTPKRRGRPPKSAGTPATAAKKKATPIRKTPARPRRTRASQSESEDLTSDISVPDPDATPKPTRTRTSTKRKNGTPAKEAGETPKPKRRGRPRKMSVIADDIIVPDAQAHPVGAESEDGQSIATGEDNASVAGSYASAPPSSHGGDDDDIWMATLSDPPTQPFSRHDSPVDEEPIEAIEQDAARLQSVDRQTETDDGADAHEDYGPAAAYSEAESVASDTPSNRVDKDTIMVQEEFTMISLHSLPSMQGNLGGSTSQYEMGEETSLIINQTLESLRHSQADSRPKTPYEDEVSFVGPSPEKDDTPRLADRSLLAPAASSPVIRPSPRRAKAQDLARQLALKSIQSKQASGSPQRQPTDDEPKMQAAEESTMYDDSFSEIPHAVLEAATPKPVRHAAAEVPEDSFSEIPEAIMDAATPRPMRQGNPQSDEEVPEPSIQLSIERHSRVNPPNPPSESNRLLTPDETPSPVLSENEQHKPQGTMTEHSDSEMQSSPPVVNHFAEERSSVARPSRRGSSETPALHVPSTRSPRRIEVAEAEDLALAAPDSAYRPTLSPIVRAGRALQMVTSDPPSPPARSPSLGSPFRASVSKSPAPSMAATQPAATSQPAPVMESSPTPQPTPALVASQDSLPVEVQRNSPWSSAFAPFKQIKNLVVQGAQAFSSPRAALSPAVQDPVVASNSASHERQDALSMHNSMFTLGSGSVDQASRSSSVEAEAAYEDEMSWQAEDTPAPRMQEQPEYPSSTTRGRRGSDAGEMPDIDMESFVEESFVGEDANDMEQEQEHEQADDFDDDIWAIEAQRPTSGRSQPEVPEKEPVLNPPRRSKLPSPWRQNSKRLVYSDELHKLASDAAAKDDEFSLLSQFSSKEPVVEEQPAKPKQVDFSAFFSSPALLPEVLPPGVSYPTASQRPFARQPDIGPGMENRLEHHAERRVTEEAEIQARTAQPVARSLFSFGRRSGEPHSDLSVAPSLPSVPQKELQIGTQRRVDLFSPVKLVPRREETEAEHSSSPSTPPRQLYPHIPQKRNFTPRSGQTSNSLFAPVSREATREPSEVYSDEEDAAEETPSPQRHSSSPAQESSFVAPVLKPLPSRAQSPTKSCIRSPLKPKTPGRVVEFTSSTLSPFAQAQAAAEDQSYSADKPSSTRANDVNKENVPTQADQPRSATFKPSFLQPNTIPHLPPPSAAAGPRLSAITWTRAHWERLDTLLQQRRATGSLAFQLAHPVPKTASSQARSKLLGKQVVAQGETMTLEQWHLDVVDAFAAEIGSGSAWDERTLAKRVFALLVGEERRRTGTIDRSKRRPGEDVVY